MLLVDKEEAGKRKQKNPKTPQSFRYMADFKIMTMNVRGLQNPTKTAVVSSYLATFVFDICLLQEGHLKDDSDILLFSREWVKGESRLE